MSRIARSARTAIGRFGEDIERALRGNQNADGGFGASPERPSGTEPTALALLALHATGDVAATARAAAWLSEHQAADGSWPRADALPSGGWGTSLAALALGRTGADAAAARRGLAWLLGVEGAGLPFLTRLKFRLFPETQPGVMDWAVKGWPWTEGAYGWVEPTSNALIALKALPSLVSRGKAAARIRDGERLLLDRACAGGGWNYGNKVTLGEELEPFPDTTALALIALQDTPRSEVVSRSLVALERMLRVTDSGLTLGLSILCFRLYGMDAAPLTERLGQRFEESGFLRETRPLALGVMALAENHMLRVADHA